MQAIIMAGGKGTRIQKIYPNTPKLLIPILNRPFLDHLVDYLKQNDCRNIIICSGHLGDKVKDYVDKNYFGASIKLSREKESLGTGGALNLINGLVEKDFFLLFGDVYTRVNLWKMLEFHKKKKAMVTAVIHESRHPKTSNLVQFNSDGRITKIFRQTQTHKPKNPYNLAAMYLVADKIKKHLLPKTPYDFENALLTKLIDENIPIYGYNTRELIMDFGTPEQLAKLEKELRK